LEALNCAREPEQEAYPDEETIDDIRTNLAQLFAESAADGSLLEALSEVQAQEEDTLPAEEDAEDIRLNVLALFTQAADDGSLSRILHEECVVEPKCDTRNIVDLRSNLSQLLSQASVDGRLFAALSDVQASEMQTRAQVDIIPYNEVHVQSCTGTLVEDSEQMCSQKDDIEDVRLSTLALFTKATEDGSLAKILSEVLAQPKSCPDEVEGAQSWRGACVLQSEECAPHVRNALRQGISSPDEIEDAKLKLRRAMSDAMSAGTFHDALTALRSPATRPELGVGSVPACTEISLATPRPPAARREPKVSRPSSSATILRKAPQVAMDATKSSELLENIVPSLPVGPAGRAFRRRRHSNNNEVASPAFCLDAGEVAENTDGRDSSLARCYDALGAQVFSISDCFESSPRPPASPAQNLKRCGRPVRSMSRGLTSATATPPMAQDPSVVSAMAMDLGDCANTAFKNVPHQPTIPYAHVQKFRAVSVGGARFGKKVGPNLLPAIKPTGRRQAHSVTSCRTSDPLAWNLGLSRRNLDSIGAVF